MSCPSLYHFRLTKNISLMTWAIRCSTLLPIIINENIFFIDRSGPHSVILMMIQDEAKIYSFIIVKTLSKLES
jgi:hypothetical protein